MTKDIEDNEIVIKLPEGMTKEMTYAMVGEAKAYKHGTAYEVKDVILPIGEDIDDELLFVSYLDNENNPVDEYIVITDEDGLEETIRNPNIAKVLYHKEEEVPFSIQGERHFGLLLKNFIQNVYNTLEEKAIEEGKKAVVEQVKANEPHFDFDSGSLV